MARGESSREKILEAASELAMSEGAAHLSLDAVAARAGVSKGGLLYNFPNKQALMRALVARFIDQFRRELDEAADGADGDRLARCYLDIVLQNIEQKTPSSSGLLAALAEDPCMMEPVREFHREVLDRLVNDAADPGATLVFFMVLEGLRAQKIFGTAVLDEEEQRLLLEKVAALVGSG